MILFVQINHQLNTVSLIDKQHPTTILELQWGMKFLTPTIQPPPLYAHYDRTITIVMTLHTRTTKLIITTTPVRLVIHQRAHPAAQETKLKILETTMKGRSPRNRMVQSNWGIFLALIPNQPKRMKWTMIIRVQYPIANLQQSITVIPTIMQPITEEVNPRIQ